MTKSQRKLYLELKLLGCNNDKLELWKKSLDNLDYWMLKALLENGFRCIIYQTWIFSITKNNLHEYSKILRIGKLLKYYGFKVEIEINIDRENISSFESIINMKIVSLKYN